MIRSWHSVSPWMDVEGTKRIVAGAKVTVPNRTATPSRWRVGQLYYDVKTGKLKNN